MTTLLYFLISLVAFFVLLYGIKQYRQYKDVVFLLILSTLIFLWYDSFIIAIGSFIGAGPLLEALSWPRFIAHLLLLPIWIIAAGALARRAGFKWAEPKFIMALFCLIGTAGIAMGAMELLKLELFPACMRGTVRYVTFVADAQACSADMAGSGHAPTGPPIAPILATLLFLIVGLMMWVWRSWPWLFLGSLFMFVMAGMPQSIAGPLLSNVAEPVIAFAALLTAKHFMTTKGKAHGP